MSLINAISSFYIPKEKTRVFELIETLKKNLSSVNIKTLHLFLDTKEDLEFILEKFRTFLENSRIKIIRIGKQPLYSDLINYANTLDGEICMIMNSDIWLHSISDMRILENMDGKLYGLTRHESDMSPKLIDRYNSPKGFIGSQDAFIFKSPVNEEILQHVNFSQNVWGSDNVLLREFQKIGYKLYDPCRQIIIVHEHTSNNREENRERLPPPWICLKPEFIELK